MVAHTEAQGDEVGARLNVQGDRSNFHHGFFIILDNVLTVSESIEGEERAGQPHPHPGGFLKGAGEGCEK